MMSSSIRKNSIKPAKISEMPIVLPSTFITLISNHLRARLDLRNYRTRASAAATAFNWSRRAVMRDARDTNVNATLDARGDGTLDEMRARYSASFKVVQSFSTRYGRDWDMGDLVRFTDEDGADFDLKVVGVNVGITSEGVETITPELQAE